MKRLLIITLFTYSLTCGQFFETEETSYPTELEKVFQPKNQSHQTETEIFEYNLNIERRSEQILQLFNEPETPPYEEPEQGLDAEGDNPANPGDESVPINQWTIFLIFAGVILGVFYNWRVRKTNFHT